MGVPNKKPKEFNLSKDEMSEASFITQTLYQYDQITEFWQSKMEEFQKRVLLRLGMLNEQNQYDADWSKMFSEQKLFLHKKPEVKVNPQTQNESQLPKKPE